MERDEASPKLGIPNPGRSGNRILGPAPAASNNRNQGKCLGTKPGALQLVVSSIDRLARSLTDLRGIVDELTDKGVTVTFLHENLAFAKDTTDPRADLMLGILGSFAEFERAIIRERQAEGIALAKKAGKYKGRKPALNPGQVAEIKQRALAGESRQH
ncbi:recombinase family protein [Corynebacterium aurimucosum]|nr:recombinase family protein [Corynebacterium aurimucosum]